MTTTLTQEQADTIREACYEVDIRPIAYSGRFMYGKQCLGVVMPDSGHLFSFALAIHEDDPDLARLLADSWTRADSMARDIVVYWPAIETDGTDFPDDDDDDEDEED